MNVTPQVIRSIMTLQEIATQLIAKDQKQAEYPLLYQKFDNGGTATMDNQDLLSTRSSLEKQQLFKQCHVSNNTTCQIQVCSGNFDYCFA